MSTIDYLNAAKSAAEQLDPGDYQRGLVDDIIENIENAMIEIEKMET